MNLKNNQKKVKASPAARKLASECGIDLSAVEGTGLNGRILPEDVRNYNKYNIFVEPKKVGTFNVTQSSNYEANIETNFVDKLASETDNIDKIAEKILEDYDFSSDTIYFEEELSEQDHEFFTTQPLDKTGAAHQANVVQTVELSSNAVEELQNKEHTNTIIENIEQSELKNGNSEVFVREKVQNEVVGIQEDSDVCEIEENESPKADDFFSEGVWEVIDFDDEPEQEDTKEDSIELSGVVEEVSAIDEPVVAELANVEMTNSEQVEGADIDLGKYENRLLYELDRELEMLDEEVEEVASAFALEDMHEEVDEVISENEVEISDELEENVELEEVEEVKEVASAFAPEDMHEEADEVISENEVEVSDTDLDEYEEELLLELDRELAMQGKEVEEVANEFAFEDVTEIADEVISENEFEVADELEENVEFEEVSELSFEPDDFEKSETPSCEEVEEVANEFAFEDVTEIAEEVISENEVEVADELELEEVDVDYEEVDIEYTDSEPEDEYHNEFIYVDEFEDSINKIDIIEENEFEVSDEFIANTDEVENEDLAQSSEVQVYEESTEPEFELEEILEISELDPQEEILEVSELDPQEEILEAIKLDDGKTNEYDEISEQLEVAEEVVEEEFIDEYLVLEDEAPEEIEEFINEFTILIPKKEDYLNEFVIQKESPNEISLNSVLFGIEDIIETGTTEESRDKIVANRAEKLKQHIEYNKMQDAEFADTFTGLSFDEVDIIDDNDDSDEFKVMNYELAQCEEEVVESVDFAYEEIDEYFDIFTEDRYIIIEEKYINEFAVDIYEEIEEDEEDEEVEEVEYIDQFIEVKPSEEYFNTFNSFKSNEEYIDKLISDRIKQELASLIPQQDVVEDTQEDEVDNEEVKEAIEEDENKELSLIEQIRTIIREEMVGNEDSSEKVDGVSDVVDEDIIDELEELEIEVEHIGNLNIYKNEIDEDKLKEELRAEIEAELVAKAEAEQLEKEQAIAKAEADRLAVEQEKQRIREEIQAEFLAEQEAKRLAKEKAEAEARAIQEVERLAKEKAEAEARAIQEAERLAKEKAEAEARAIQEAERVIAEEKARIAKEKEEQLAREIRAEIESKIQVELDQKNKEIEDALKVVELTKAENLKRENELRRMSNARMEDNYYPGSNEFTSINKFPMNNYFIDSNAPYYGQREQYVPVQVNMPGQQRMYSSSYEPQYTHAPIRKKSPMVTSFVITDDYVRGILKNSRVDVNSAILNIIVKAGATSLVSCAINSYDNVIKVKSFRRNGDIRTQSVYRAQDSNFNELSYFEEISDEKGDFIVWDMLERNVVAPHKMDDSLVNIYLSRGMDGVRVEVFCNQELLGTNKCTTFMNEIKSYVFNPMYMFR